MPKPAVSVRIDQQLLAAASKILRAKNKSRAIELALQAVIEMDRHRRLIQRFAGKAKPYDFELS